MAVSSFTERRAFAGAATFLLIGVSQVLSGLLAVGLNGSDNFLLLSLTRTPVALVQYIYGQRQLDEFHLGLGVEAATVAFTTLVSAAIVYYRYQRLQVTR
jgi:predicted permease